MEPKPLPITDGNRSHDRRIRTSTALKRVKKPPGVSRMICAITPNSAQDNPRQPCCASGSGVTV